MNLQKIWICLLVFGCVGCDLTEAPEIVDDCPGAKVYKDSSGKEIGKFTDPDDKYYEVFSDYHRCPAEYPVCNTSGNESFCHELCRDNEIFCASGCVDPEKDYNFCGAKKLCNDTNPESKNFTGYMNCRNCTDGICDCGENAHFYLNTCEEDSIEHCGDHETQCQLSDFPNAEEISCENKVCTIKSCNSGSFFDPEHKSCITCRDVIKGAQAGNVIKLGRYYQESNNEEDKQPLEWRVLKIYDHGILAISRYNLRARSFHCTNVEVSWKNSGVRSWLNAVKTDNCSQSADYSIDRNASFIGTVFNDEEQKCIQKFNTSDVVETTEDLVFLLSKEEASEVFSDNAKRKAYITDYALSGVTTEGAYPDDCEGARCFGPYWLRSPIVKCTKGNKKGYCAPYVDSKGDIVEGDGRVYVDISENNNIGVRPAIYLKK